MIRYHERGQRTQWASVTVDTTSCCPQCLTPRKPPYDRCDGCDAACHLGCITLQRINEGGMCSTLRALCKDCHAGEL